MREHELRHLIEDVREGRLPRRSFVKQMVGLGLTAPMASMMLMHARVAQALRVAAYKPTKRGGGGVLKVLWWQGATLLNPHFAVGTKDQEGCRIFYEPLAGWDADGNLVPFLAAEVPTLENGGLDKDGMSVTWKLKQNVKWHDGTPFTADDCVFNWEYGKDPATASVSIGSYKDVMVEKVDNHTVRVKFSKPTPFWADALGARPTRDLIDQLESTVGRHYPALADLDGGRYAHTIPSPSADPGSILEIAGPGWALVGDAAALADPITGEGIFPALRSAEILASTLIETGSTTAYPGRLLNDLGHELHRAAALRDRFYSPGFTDRMVRYAACSRTIRSTLADLVLGEQGYLALKRRLLLSGPRFLLEYGLSALRGC